MIIFQDIYSKMLDYWAHYSAILDISPWVKMFAPYIILAAKEPVVVALILFGFWFLSQKIFSRSLVVICFTLVVSFFLKCLWKAPLPPGVHVKTWAFPSGHMLWACVFWGYVAWSQTRVWIRVLVLAFLALYGWSIIVLGYHYPKDVLAAIGFAILILGVIFRLERSERVRCHPPAFAAGLWLIAALAFSGTLWLAWLRPETVAGFAGLTAIVVCEMVGFMPGSIQGLPLRQRFLGFIASCACAALLMFYLVPLLQGMTNRSLADSVGFVGMIVLSTVIVPKFIQR